MHRVRRSEMARLTNARSARDPLVVAIDIGSSSIRAAVYDATGTRLRGTMARRTYTMQVGAGGAVTVEPGTLVALVTEVIDALAGRVGRTLDRCRAIAVSGFMHGLVPLDVRGRPLAAVASWADTTAAPAAAELRDELDEAEVWQRTGAPLHASYWPAKIRALQRRPGDRIARWSGGPEHVVETMTGAAMADVSLASATGLVDRRTGDWDAPLLEHLAVEARRLPILRQEAAWDVTVRPPYVSRWPALARVPWLPPFADGACGNVGLGCRSADAAALMIGTSSALRVLTPDSPDTLPAGLFSFRLGAASLLGGQLSEGGGVVAWLARLTGWAPARLERAAAELLPDGHGLTILPYLLGERGPGYHADARGTVAGLSATTGPAELFRASLESVALRLAIIDRLLTTALAGPPRIVASGGALGRSVLWPAIVADVLGREIVLPAEDEPSMRGAAVLALEALGVDVASERAELVADATTVAPDHDRHARYRDALERQERLYERVV